MGGSSCANGEPGVMPGKPPIGKIGGTPGNTVGDWNPETIGGSNCAGGLWFDGSGEGRCLIFGGCHRTLRSGWIAGTSEWLCWLSGRTWQGW